MCGFVCTVDSKKTIGRDDINELISRLKHRGPDSAGVFSAKNGSVWFGHTRLAIQDLSPAGHQPMVHAATGNILVFNGEIYNKRELKESLERDDTLDWTGDSDTEVLLHALSCRAIERVCDSIRGMFSFAFLNVSENVIYIARDSAGEKPLYYGESNGIQIVSSELSTLRDSTRFSFEISSAALKAYLQYNFVPDPLTIFTKVKKLLPGTFAKLCLSSNCWARPSRYIQDDNDCFNNSQVDIGLKTAEYFQSKFENVINKVVDSQLISDAPLGCFLSGGYDSTLIASIAQDHTEGKLKTFSLGFDNSNFNEAPFAATVASLLHTDHHEIVVSKEDMFRALSIIPSVWDEPFGDSSQLPSLLLSEFASKDVRVALSGDGADEHFGGYGRHTFMHKFRNYFPLISPHLQNLTGKVARNFPSQHSLGFLKSLKSSSKVNRLFNVISSTDPLDRYVALIGNRWSSVSPVIFEAQTLVSQSTDLKTLSNAYDLMLADQNIYLPGDILVKIDRASMYYSLETRAPFLDRRVTQVASEYNAHSARRGVFHGKNLIRSAVHKRIPQELMNRPKKGFSIPIVEWLNGDLNEWAQSGIARLRKREIIDDTYIDFVLEGQNNGHRDASSAVWSLLMLDGWLSDTR